MGSVPHQPATVAAFSPGHMLIEDVASLGEACARAVEALDNGASLVAVRDSYGILQLALDDRGRVWSRGDDETAAAVAGWGVSRLRLPLPDRQCGPEPGGLRRWRRAIAT